MKSLLAAVCCLSMCSIPALAQKAMGDQEFLDFAAQTDMVEANLGQLAQTAGSALAVKDFGKMLSDDHTGDFTQLTQVAAQANLKMPTAIDDAHVKAMIAPMHKLNGAAFDKKYIGDMIAGHTKAIQVYKAEAANSKNSVLQTYAQQVLPVLEKHLSGAKDLQKSGGSK